MLVLATAAASQAAASSPGYADVGADDAVALLQQDVRTHRRKAALALDRFSLLANFSMSGHERQPVFDCAAFPELCQAPFNCDQHDLGKEVGQVLAKGMGYHGVNLPLWCFAPQYAPYASQCVAGDLDRAGKTLFELTKAGTFGENVLEMDASYCFIDGHCTNSEVTNSTTLEEATRMCDERFGREAWVHAGNLLSTLKSTMTSPLPNANGFTSQEQTRPFLLFACAMGNYHCDVRYCHETYCKDEYYIRKYSHFLKDYGWVQ